MTEWRAHTKQMELTAFDGEPAERLAAAELSTSTNTFLRHYYVVVIQFGIRTLNEASGLNRTSGPNRVLERRRWSETHPIFRHMCSFMFFHDGWCARWFRVAHL